MIISLIKNRLVWVMDTLLSRLYNSRHPGLLEQRLIASMSGLVRACQPNDKWNLHVMAPAWVEAVHCPPVLPLPKAKSLFIFCVYRGVFTTHLVLAVLLAWRGHRVTIGYLPKLQSPNKHPLKDHPSAKPYLRMALSQIGVWTKGKITCVDLSEDSDQVQIDERFVEKQAHYDTVMAYQKEGLDLTDPAVHSLHNHMLEIGRRAQIAIRNHFKVHRYDICIVGNGTTFEGAHACRILNELGLAVNSTEKFAFRGVRVINHGDHFLNADDLDLIWANRDMLGYTKEPYLSKFLEQARQSIQERSKNSTKTWYWELQRAVNQSEREAFETAGVPLDRPFVLVCPNVVFDAGYGKITNVFPSMKEWLFGTIEFLLANTNHLIVVRAHPGEGLWWGGKEPVDQVLAQRGLRQSKRLVVIPGQARVNTYRLMERCLMGVVFSSSTGLEMAVMGKHVVTGSNVIYSKRGFTYDADTQSDYYQRLKDLGICQHLSPTDPGVQQLALLFYFAYHWVAQYPYPYDKPSGIVRRPPKELLQSGDVKRYFPYLDLISMDKNEFSQNLELYLGADKVLERLQEKV
jgi:hypothetical protein